MQINFILFHFILCWILQDPKIIFRHEQLSISFT